MWVQVAGALAEAGVGLEEITNRVSVVAKAMGECWPRGRGGGGGGQGQPWTRSSTGLPGYSPRAEGGSPGDSQVAEPGFCPITGMGSLPACLREEASAALPLPGLMPDAKNRMVVPLTPRFS